MIIQVRGTSGSGKSTAVRRFMETAEWTSEFRDGRKNPYLYWTRDIPPGKVVVLGHYNSPCGGGDTIGSAAAIYDAIKEVIEGNGPIPIVVEGLLLSEDSKWAKVLKEEGNEVVCLFLTTPLDQCLSQIEGRRKAVGNEKPVNPKNTANRVGTIERARAKLTTAGVRCIRCSANQAPALISKLLTGS